MKRIVSLFITVAMFIGVLPTVSMADTLFVDLEGYEWAQEYIIDLADKGVINGVGSGLFAPGDNLTREQFAKIVVEALGYTTQNVSCDFTDVDKNSWYYPYVAAISSAGIVNGIGNDMFGVGNSVSLQDMMVILYRILVSDAARFPAKYYEDYTKLAEEYARDPIGHLVNVQIYPAQEALIDYRAPASRANAAKVVSLVLDYHYSGQVVGERVTELPNEEAQWADFKLGAEDYEWHGLDYQGKDMDNLSPEDVLDARLREAGDEIPVFEPVEVKGEIKIFVSNEGNDETGDGSIEKPYKTLEKAKNVFRAFNDEEKKKGVVIYIRGGTYSISDSVTFDTKASGTPDAPLFIAAYNDEEVTITAGKALDASKFKRVSDMGILSALTSDAAQDNLYVASFKDLGITDNDLWLNTIEFPVMFMNGVQMNISRYPNDYEWSSKQLQIIQNGMMEGDEENVNGYEESMQSRGGMYVEEGLPKYYEPDERVHTWKYSKDIWASGSLYVEYFRRNHLIRDITDGVVTLTVPLSNFGRIAPLWAHGGTRYYSNIIEETDLPGEFTVDYANELIYMYPIGDIDGAELLLRPAGKYDKHISRETLTPAANAAIRLKDASNIVIDNLKFTTSTRALEVHNSIYCAIQNCWFLNNNTTVRLNNASSIAVINNVFENSGDLLFEGNNATTRRPNMAKCILQNNIFTHGEGTEYSYHGNIISHNVVHDLAGNFLTGNYSDFIMEYNEVIAAPGRTSDGGTIYDGGLRIPNMTLTRYNYIHENTGVGIYFDDLGYLGLAYGNIVANTENRGIHLHNTSLTAIKNNILVNSSMGMSANYHAGYLEYLGTQIVTEEPKKTEYTDVEKSRYPFAVAREELYYNQLMEIWNKGAAYNMNADPYRKEIHMPTRNSWIDNYVFNGKMEDLTFGISRPEEVKGNVATMDEPGFTDIENGDFTFKEDAPILAIESFNGMDEKFNKIGLTCEAPLDKLTTKPVNMFPTNDSQIDTGTTRFFFKQASLALYHDIELSLDPEFTKIFHKERLRAGQTSVDINIGYSDIECYWRVTPVYMDATINLPVESSECFKFTTK